jgi:uncharacterized integral membrane protein
MVRLVVAIVLTIAVVGFSMANTHHVQLERVLAEPIQIRLIFLLAMAYIGGAVTAFFYQMVARLKRAAQRRALQQQVMQR